MSNENKFKTTMLLLAEVYGRELSPDTVRVYWAVLGKCKPEHLHHAALKQIETSEWFPKPATLKKIISGYEFSEKQHMEMSNALNRIERKPPTDEQKKRVSDLIKGLKNEL